MEKKHTLKYLKGGLHMACENVKNCPCTKTECENHSVCCNCVLNHKEKGNLPFCLRPPEGTA